MKNRGRGGGVTDDNTSDERETKLYPIQSIFQTEEPPLIRSSNRQELDEEIHSPNYGALTVGVAARREQLNHMEAGTDSNLQTALPREYREYDELAESDDQPAILVHVRENSEDNYPRVINQIPSGDDNTELDLTNEGAEQ